MALAQVDIGDPDINPTAQFSDIGRLLNQIIPLLTLGAAILFLIMFFYGGFTVITAGGDPERVKLAQKTMKFAVIGLIVVVVAFLIVRVIGIVFEIDFPFFS